MINWNVEFTGNTKNTSKKEVFASDKALRYSQRVMLNELINNEENNDENNIESN